MNVNRYGLSASQEAVVRKALRDIRADLEMAARWGVRAGGKRRFTPGRHPQGPGRPPVALRPGMEDTAAPCLHVWRLSWRGKG
jgi:hypothetical protein